MQRQSFNPRAREGRDEPDDGDCIEVHVSIHAPARGATPLGQPGADAAVVSIHAPARGATSASVSAQVRSLSFNPRAREGRD